MSTSISGSGRVTYGERRATASPAWPASVRYGAGQCREILRRWVERERPPYHFGGAIVTAGLVVEKREMLER